MPDRAKCINYISEAVARRADLLTRGQTDVCRVFHGEADGIAGLFIDRYGPGATLIHHEGRLSADLPEPAALAEVLLRSLSPFGVRAVYDKPFVRNRSGGGGRESVLTDPVPLAGEQMAESLIVSEHGRRFEVRLFDGFSTGLFLDQRENRSFLAHGAKGLRVLNLFAYTAGFSVACAMAGAVTTSVDVSGRYLEWAKRNFALNGIEPGEHHFARMDAREFLAMAERKGMRFDLVILDPPTFAAGDRRRGVKPWSAARDYGGLVAAARAVVSPGGRIFCSTNCADLCAPGRLEREIEGALTRVKWLDTPQAPKDFPGDADRARWVMTGM